MKEFLYSDNSMCGNV